MPAVHPKKKVARKSKKTSLLLRLDEDLYKQVEDYRFAHRIASRLEAIRILIRKGLRIGR